MIAQKSNNCPKAGLTRFTLPILVPIGLRPNEFENASWNTAAGCDWFIAAYAQEMVFPGPFEVVLTNLRDSWAKLTNKA